LFNASRTVTTYLPIGFPAMSGGGTMLMQSGTSLLAAVTCAEAGLDEARQKATSGISKAERMTASFLLTAADIS
jgi:hypothetical protein